LGARILQRARSSALRHVFTLVIVLLGLQMIYKGMGGRGL
jgi:uncharacterized membrane protein YfcA